MSCQICNAKDEWKHGLCKKCFVAVNGLSIHPNNMTDRLFQVAVLAKLDDMEEKIDKLLGK